MNVREVELPGIGQKYEMHTRSGDHLIIIVHNDGRRECFHMDPEDPGEVLSVVTLEDEESRMTAAILSGITYKPKYLDKQDSMLEDLLIEWTRLESSSACIGKQIGELDIARLTGAVILAIVEKGKAADLTPGPDTVLKAGQLLVVAGERPQIKELQRLLSIGKNG